MTHLRGTTLSSRGPARQRGVATACTLAGAVLLAACAPQALTVTPQPIAIRVVTADACARVTRWLTVAYTEDHPWVRFDVEVYNSSIAQQRLQAGSADLAFVSWLEPVADGLWSAPFATDAIAVVVHPGVAATNLALAQLREVYRGRMGEWSDATAIQVVSREAGAGLRRAFETAVMGDYEVTLAAVVMSSDQLVLDYVAATPGAVGYVAAGQPMEGVRVLAIDGTTPEQGATASYPLTYELLVAAAGEPIDELREFTQWVLGPRGQEEVAAHLTLQQR